MLIVLIVVAAVLVAAILATFISSNRDDGIGSSGIGASQSATDAFGSLEPLTSSLPTNTRPTNTRPTNTRPTNAFGSPPPRPQDSSPLHTSGSGAFSPSNLRVGSHISCPNGSGRIAGVVHFDEDGWIWSEWLVDDTANGKWWLSVEQEAGLRTTAFTPTRVSKQPGTKTITANGTTYHLKEMGAARYRATGATDTNGQGTCDYADYTGADGSQLGFERFDGGQWEVSAGRVITSSQIQIT